MTQQISHTEILKLWPNRRTLARDMVVPYTTVQAWEVRNSIPERYFHKLVEIAAAERRDVTMAGLLEYARTSKAERRRDRAEVRSAPDCQADIPPGEGRSVPSCGARPEGLGSQNTKARDRPRALD